MKHQSDDFEESRGQSKVENRADTEVNVKTSERLTLLQLRIIFGAALGLACGFGAVFLSVTSVFLKPMAASFGWGRADVSSLPMLAMMGVAIGAPLLGSMGDRIGWKKLIAGSIVCFSLGLLAMSLAPANRFYVMTVGVLVGILGAGTSVAGYISVISQVFDRRFGMAMGFSLMGSGLGAAVMPMVAGKLLEFMDWRQAYACIGGVCLLFGLFAHQIIFRAWEPPQMGVRASASRSRIGGGDSGQVGAGMSFSEVVGSYRYWLIGSLVFLGAAATFGVTIHMVSYASDRGISLSAATRAVGMLGFGTVATRLVCGLILDRVFAPLVHLVIFLIGAAGLYLLTTDLLLTEWGLPLAAIFIGIMHGAEGDIFPYLCKKYFGAISFGGLYGTLVTFATMGGASGAYLYGLTFDSLKSYVPALQVSVAVCIVCGFAVFLLGRYPEFNRQN